MKKRVSHQLRDRWPAIGARLRHARMSQEVLQQDFARAIGTSSAYVSQVETGKRAIPVWMILSAAEQLGISPDALLLGGKHG